MNLQELYKSYFLHKKIGMTQGELLQFQYNILLNGGEFNYKKEKKENINSITKRIESLIKNYQENPSQKTLHSLTKFLSKRYIEVYELTENQTNIIEKEIPTEIIIEESMDESFYLMCLDMNKRYSRDVNFL